MNRMLWFALLVGVCAAWLEDTNYGINIQNGAWINLDNNFDDREEKSACKASRYQLIGCYCALSPKDVSANRWCDGNWLEWDETGTDVECHSFTNAQTEGYIRAVSVCQQTIVYPMEPPKSKRLGPNPEVSCPEGYTMLSCWAHSDNYDKEHWINRAVLTKDIPHNSCKLTNCQSCRIQASCLANNPAFPPTLDTFPYPAV